MRSSGNRLLSLAAAMLAAVLAPVGAFATSQLFDPASFGTGVCVGTSGCPALATATPFHSSSSEDVSFSLSGFVTAEAHADFQGFSVGVQATSTVLDGGDFSGGAVAYTGLTVSGATPLTLNGSFTLEGGFFSDNFVRGTPIVDPADNEAEVDLWVYDIHGDLLAEAFLAGAGLGTSYVLQCLDPSCDAAHRNFSYQSGNLWTDGSIQVPFSVSLGADNGVLVEMWARARDLLPNDGNPVNTDFLHTASLGFAPPPGVTVTLASGQSFVPEPSSGVLLATALLGVGAARRKPGIRGAR